MHTSEGKYLVTRLVPCPRCLCGLKAPMDSLEERSDAVSGPARAARGSPVSAVSDGADSGVGGESPLSGYAESRFCCRETPCKTDAREAMRNFWISGLK